MAYSYKLIGNEIVQVKKSLRRHSPLKIQERNKSKQQEQSS